MSRRARPACVAAALVAVALALAGCSSFITITAVQQDVIGKVRVEVAICADTFGGTTVLAYGAVTGECRFDPGGGGNGSSMGQLMIAYLLADGVVAPATMTSSNVPGLVFHASPGYATEAQTIQSAPAGTHWVGYLSDVIDEIVTGAKIVRVAADLTLPQTGGAPFAGPVSVDLLLGDRMVDATHAADRAVECTNGGADGTSLCNEDTGTVSTPTRDLVLRATGGASVKAGQAATLPFEAQFAGTADPAATFALTATTPIAGATATPEGATFAPATDSTSTHSVAVSVPASTPAGSYPVTLTATVGGETRSATATLTIAAGDAVAPPPPPVAVLPPPAPKPLPKLVAGLRDYGKGTTQPSPPKLFSGGLPVRVGCNQKCTLSVDVLVYDNRRFKVSKGRPPGTLARMTRATWKFQPTLLVARRYVSLRQAGTRTVHAQLFDPAKAVLDHVNNFTLVVVATAVDARGRQRTKPTVGKHRFREVCENRDTRCVTGEF